MELFAAALYELIFAGAIMLKKIITKFFHKKDENEYYYAIVNSNVLYDVSNNDIFMIDGSARLYVRREDAIAVVKYEANYYADKLNDYSLVKIRVDEVTIRKGFLVQAEEYGRECLKLIGNDDGQELSTRLINKFSLADLLNTTEFLQLVSDSPQTSSAVYQNRMRSSTF